MCALGTGQEALKSEISTTTTQLKNDIGNVIEDTVGSGMSIITGLKTEINDIQN
jgi:hypothetical protein